MSDLQPFFTYEGGRVVAEVRGLRGCGRTRDEALAQLVLVLQSAGAAQALRRQCSSQRPPYRCCLDAGHGGDWHHAADGITKWPALDAAELERRYPDGAA